MKFIALASLLISIGSYLVATKGQLLVATLQQSRSLDFGTILFLLIGLLLNLLGSISWILGRKSVSSYFFAWSSYLALLIVFGALIALMLDKEPFTPAKVGGMILLIMSLMIIQAN